MITHSIGGVVFSKIGKTITILLTTRVKIKLKIKRTSLKLGDKVHVVYNNETGRVKEVLAEGTVLTNPKAIEVLPWETYPPPDDSYIGELEW